MLKYSYHIPEKLTQKLLDYGYGYGSESIRSRIPTYYEVFEWFSEEKGIIITLEPFFTYALNGNIAYTWKVSYPDEGKLTTTTEEDVYTYGSFGGSFCLTADAAIEFAMGLGDKRIKFTEVDINTI